MDPTRCVTGDAVSDEGEVLGAAGGRCPTGEATGEGLSEPRPTLGSRPAAGPPAVRVRESEGESETGWWFGLGLPWASDTCRFRCDTWCELVFTLSRVVLCPGEHLYLRV